MYGGKKSLAWIVTVLVFGLVLSGCIVPRTLGKGIQGLGRVIEGTGDVVSAPFKQ